MSHLWKHLAMIDVGIAAQAINNDLEKSNSSSSNRVIVIVSNNSSSNK